MNFLELCQALRRESGTSGNGPVSVENQQGEYRRIVEWVRQANMEIQSIFTNWKFLWRSFSVELKPGDTVIAPPPRLNLWRTGSLVIDGEPVQMVEQHTRPPVSDRDMRCAVIMPDNRLELSHAVTDAGNATAEYWLAPQRLEDSDDEPLLPDSLQMLIVWRALMKCANYENAPELKNTAIENYQALYPQLMATQLPGQSQYSTVNDAPLVITPE